jgi:exopolyphosphatase/guanosine-5'-triphosphate,3'-diphosphate pyrophosphatase
MKIAVIDIGSNSLRMQISEIKNGVFEIVEDFKEMLRLGDDVFNTGYISENSIDRLVNILTEIKAICLAKSVQKIRTIATASFREAKNAEDVIKAVKAKIDIDIEIIDGNYEAKLGFIGVKSNFDIESSKVLITDIGGGSAEFVIAEKGKIKFYESTPLGCNKLLHLYFKNNPPKEEEIIAFKNDIYKALHSIPIDRTIEHIICLGGTINNISFIKNNRSASKTRYTDRKFLKGFLRNITKKTIQERINSIKNLEPKRADIILPAAIFIDKILDIAGKSGFYTLSGGLRSGLTIETINKMGIVLDFQKTKSNLRLSRLMDIGKKFNFEKKHAVWVKKLALIIFEKTKNLHNLGEKEKRVLEAAALLHDIGNYISYSKHHKHSYYLVKNSDFIGYSQEEIELIANIARYHRKSLPKSTHENFIILKNEEQNLVKILSGILRIADALDRTHESKIKDIEIEIKKDKIYFNLKHSVDVLAEIMAFSRKKELFEKTFKLKAEIK